MDEFNDDLTKPPIGRTYCRQISAQIYDDNGSVVNGMYVTSGNIVIE